MDRQLSDAYASVTERLASDGSDRERFSDILKLIDKASNKIEIDIRADARLFLGINTIYMIDKPYRGYGNFSNLTNNQFDKLLYDALVHIMKQAKGDQPYSSHSMLRAIEDSWIYLSDTFLWA